MVDFSLVVAQNDKCYCRKFGAPLKIIFVQFRNFSSPNTIIDCVFSRKYIFGLVQFSIHFVNLDFPPSPYSPWWRHQMETFSALLTLCGGVHRSTKDFPHKGQWHRALMFSLICAWTYGWANHRDAGDLRRHQAYYDVTLMHSVA